MDGLSYYARTGASKLVVLAAAVIAASATGCSGSGTGPAQLADDCPGCVVHAVVRWSNGGRSIVFTASEPGGKLRQYVVGADATGLRRITKRVRRPARVWTRSRNRVAYVEDEAIVVRSRRGRLLGSPTDSCPADDACYDEVFDSDPSWSPDGGWLLFTRSVYDFCGFCLAPGPSWFRALGVAHLDGTGCHWVMTGEEADDDSSGSWSPDGRHIAFVRDESLYVIEVDLSGFEIAMPRLVVVRSNRLSQGT